MVLVSGFLDLVSSTQGQEVAKEICGSLLTPQRGRTHDNGTRTDRGRWHSCRPRGRRIACHPVSHRDAHMDMLNMAVPWSLRDSNHQFLANRHDLFNPRDLAGVHAWHGMAGDESPTVWVVRVFGIARSNICH